VKHPKSLAGQAAALAARTHNIQGRAATTQGNGAWSYMQRRDSSSRRVGVLFGSSMVAPRPFSIPPYSRLGPRQNSPQIPALAVVAVSLSPALREP